MNASSCIYTSPYMAPQALHSERDRYLTQLDSWSSAFLPVLNRLRQTASNLKEITGALLLHMYAISARIAILGTLITEECTYDLFLPEFQKIVALAWEVSQNLLQLTTNRAAYHFHLSIVPPVFGTLLRCRDFGLGREALAVLRMKHRDGPWDRYMLAGIASWIVDVEEEGRLDSGYIPEHNRFRLTRLSIGPRAALVQCVKRSIPLGTGTRFTWRETTICR